MSYALGLKRAEIYRGNGKIPAWLCVCVYLCVCVSLDFDMKVLCRCSRPSTDDFGTAQHCPFVSEHKNTNLSIFMSLNIADLRGSRLQLQDLDYVKDIERWRKKILSASTGRLSLHTLKKHMEREINREKMSHFQALASKLKVQSCTLAEKLVLVLNAFILYLLLILTNAKWPTVTH